MADKKNNDALLKKARERFIIASDAEAQIREAALEDLRFRAGDQWPDEIKRQRFMDQRPCLTINQIPQFVRQITNDQRQNRPSIQIDPVGDGADVATAEVLEGMVRHIQYDSGADAAYDTAFQAAVTSGFGYFRVNTEYSDPMSFEQDIKILRIRNAFTVYFDPTCKEPDYSDAMYAFVVEKLAKDEFKEQYPDAEITSMGDWTSTGDGWIEAEECRVAEYFYREMTEIIIYLLKDGSVTKDKPKDEESIVNKRRTQEFKVKWCKINGSEVLEETDWPGKWIPIIPVLGDELDVDGERILEGIVRNAKDPQRQYNFMASATTETIALAPKSPFVGAAGQFENFENSWQRANISNQPYLEYNPVSLNGQPAPPPQRQEINPAIQATTVAMMQSSQDLKSVTGIYQASLGQQGNETSGAGIKARQQQSSGANFHFVDNLTRSLRHAGTIILDLIPHIYDTKRVIRIVEEDGTVQQVQLTPGMQPGQQPQLPDGIKQALDVTVGKYSVVVNTGPSYQTKRQESVAATTDLVRAFPAIMPVAGDIIVRSMDFPGAQKIADRMEKMLPPQLQDQNGQPQIPPQVQQEIAQGKQMIQQLTQELQKTTEELTQKTNIKAMELESKERIHFSQLEFEKESRIPLDYEKLRVSVVNAELAAKSQANIKQAEAEKEIILQQGEQAHEYAMQQDQQENQQEMMQQQSEQENPDGEQSGQVSSSSQSSQQPQVQPAQTTAGQS